MADSLQGRLDASIDAMRTARRLAHLTRQNAHDLPASYAYFMRESARHFRRARSYLKDIRMYRAEIAYRLEQEARYARAA